jgi:hypothetical protein
MSKSLARIVCLLPGLLLIAVMVNAGGVDPKEMPAQEPMKREKVSATPAQTSVAVSKARRAVVPVVEEAPVVKEVPMSSFRPKAVSAASTDSWLLGSREGECAPLSSVSRKVKNIGTFKTPQEFARQMQQRGYQAFVLDIGDVRDQVVRVKVPDMELDLTFMKAGLCR